MNLIYVTLFISAILLSGCVTFNDMTETLDSEIEAYEPYYIPDIPRTSLPVPIPTPKFEPVEILLNDIIENNVTNKSHYTMIGGSKDVHVCGNMACEQAEWIADNYGYETGIVILWAKHQGESHAQTWVMIDDDQYIFESTFDTYWSESDHRNRFGGSNKICFVSIKKGREHVKATAEYIRKG